jgi:hypothetical protein
MPQALQNKNKAFLFSSAATRSTVVSEKSEKDDDDEGGAHSSAQRMRENEGAVDVIETGGGQVLPRVSANVEVPSGIEVLLAGEASAGEQNGEIPVVVQQAASDDVLEKLVDELEASHASQKEEDQEDLSCMADSAVDDAQRDVLSEHVSSEKPGGEELLVAAAQVKEYLPFFGAPAEAEVPEKKDENSGVGSSPVVFMPAPLSRSRDSFANLTIARSNCRDEATPGKTP